MIVRYLTMRDLLRTKVVSKSIRIYLRHHHLFKSYGQCRFNNNTMTFEQPTPPLVLQNKAGVVGLNALGTDETYNFNVCIPYTTTNAAIRFGLTALDTTSGIPTPTVDLRPNVEEQWSLQNDTNRTVGVFVHLRITPIVFLETVFEKKRNGDERKVCDHTNPYIREREQDYIFSLSYMANQAGNHNFRLECRQIDDCMTELYESANSPFASPYTWFVQVLPDSHLNTVVRIGVQ